MILDIDGFVPSKKNQWKPSPGGRGVYLPSDITAQIEVITDRAWIGWRQLHGGVGPILEHPTMAFTFHVNNRASDRDNKLSTILDVLQKAKVIRNDNVKYFNGRIVIEPAVICGPSEERTVIEIL